MGASDGLNYITFEVKWAPTQHEFMKQLQRINIGIKGEELATRYLKKQGYHIITRNFKARYGELDIIAVKDTVLVIIEVKTRLGRMYGLPEESVTPRKLHEVIQTTQYFKLLHPELPDDLRIDVIGIELDEADNVKYFNHIQNVTG